jgi:hypothetical protein
MFDVNVSLTDERTL